MAKQIIVNLELFTKDQTVILVDDKTINRLDRIPTEQLYFYLPMICCSNNCDNIHLYGNTEYLNKIVEQIETTEISKYKNKINIEVN